MWIGTVSPTSSRVFPMPSASQSADPTTESMIGMVIDDKYRVDALLGEGGMGAVFRAHHLGLRREFALKVLRPELASHAEVAARFDREAHSAARLDHPNCLQVTDFGTTPAGLKYMVMQLLSGHELSAELQHGALAPGRAVALMLQIVRGLEHAHDHGIVHRDIKPENVFVTRDHDGRERLKLVDFGIAKVLEGELDDASPKLTRVGMVFGTPRYMSPEQAAGGEIDHRSDLYSAGVIFYEMLAGRVPFEGDDLVKVLRRQVVEPPPPLPDDVPAPLRVIVERLLAKDRQERFSDAAALVRVLEASGVGPAATPFGASGTAPTMASIPVGAAVTGRAATGQAATGRAATGQAATGGAATGGAATGGAATGGAATGGAATGAGVTGTAPTMASVPGMEVADAEASGRAPTMASVPGMEVADAEASGRAPTMANIPAMASARARARSRATGARATGVGMTGAGVTGTAPTMADIPADTGAIATRTQPGARITSVTNTSVGPVSGSRARTSLPTLAPTAPTRRLVARPSWPVLAAVAGGVLALVVVGAWLGGDDDDDEVAPAGGEPGLLAGLWPSGEGLSDLDEDALASIDGAIVAGRLEQAQDELVALEQEHPDHPHLLWRRGRLLAQDDATQREALTTYGRAAEGDPALLDQPVFFAELGRLLREPELETEAVRVAVEQLGHPGHAFLLERLNDLDEPLPRAERKQATEAVLGHEECAPLLDARKQIAQDLLQASAAEDPCAEFGAKLTLIEFDLDAIYLEPVHAAKLPRGCKQHKAKLAEVRAALAAKHGAAKSGGNKQRCRGVRGMFRSGC